MIFRQCFDPVSSTYTYLIASGVGREALLIDPVKSNIDQYLKLLNELQLKLVIALDTHMHTDHITGTGTLHESLNCVIAMGAQTKAECVGWRLKDNEIFCVGDLELKAIYTPGHTDDSYSFFMDDRVFTGDTLLIRGTGRTDFQNGDPYQQYDSLFHRLLTLPEETFVYPAHDYKGMMVSTIREEKRYNPRLQVKSADEYAALMNALNLPPPVQMHIAVPANLRCGCSHLEERMV